MPSTSESLLLRIRDASDHQAWSRFVRLYTPMLFYWSRAMGLQPQDSADLAQEVLTIVFRKLPDFAYDPARSFRGWLRTIAVNKFHERCRRRSVMHSAQTGSVVERVQDQAACDESSWDLSYRRSLFHSALEMLRDEFQPATWAAVRSYLLSGRPAAEIARETGVSVWTIYAAKSRLLARLRTILAGLLD